MRELNKNAWVFEMTVDESCKNIDDISGKGCSSYGDIRKNSKGYYILQF